MQTRLIQSILEQDVGKEADQILRSCVHCGFCTATCPTYQVMGDELDSPRGRIYLIKQMLEGEPVTELTRTHLDRCLQCRSCETTCPSGVEYLHLLDIGQSILSQSHPESLLVRLKRKILFSVMVSNSILALSLKLARTFSFLLPNKWHQKLNRGPEFLSDTIRSTPAGRGDKVMMLDPCVQSALRPSIDEACELVLNNLDYETVKVSGSGCCGAIHYHGGERKAAMAQMKKNMDVWCDAYGQGASHLLATSSGCLAFLKEYAHIFRNDPDYGDKATQVTQIATDASELIGEVQVDTSQQDTREKIAFHAPCTLQHSLKLASQVEMHLSRIASISTPEDAHLCCGSAGTYSIRYKEIASELRKRKLKALEVGSPEKIVTANIGCLTHMQGESYLPVVHWLEYLAEHIQQGKLELHRAKSNV